jgi:hypothetical protein
MLKGFYNLKSDDDVALATSSFSSRSTPWRWTDGWYEYL